MQTAIAEKTRTKAGEKELKRARRMIDRAFPALETESRRRNKLGEVTTMRPADLCPGQGQDVVNRL